MATKQCLFTEHRLDLKLIPKIKIFVKKRGLMPRFFAVFEI